MLLTEEPVLDVYAYGPWRVPDGLYEEMRERAVAYNTDQRAVVLTRQLSDFYGSDTSAAGAEQWSLLTFLLGASAVRGGSRGDVDYELLSDFLATPESAVRDPAAWFTQGGRWRPPGLWLPEPAGDDRERRAVMFELARDGLDVFEGLEPIERRRRALMDLFDRRAADPELREIDMTVPNRRLEDAWVSGLTDEELAVLPELSGPVGYLGWAVGGLDTAHERLAGTVADGDEPDTALARLLLAAEAPVVPAELAVVLGTARYENVEERFRAAREGFSAEAWQYEVRAWLARGLVAGRRTPPAPGWTWRCASPARCRACRTRRSARAAAFRCARSRPTCGACSRSAGSSTRWRSGPPGPPGGDAKESPARPEADGRPLVGQPELSRLLLDAVSARLDGVRAVRLLVAARRAPGRAPPPRSPRACWPRAAPSASRCGSPTRSSRRWA